MIDINEVTAICFHCMLINVEAILIVSQVISWCIPFKFVGGAPLALCGWIAQCQVDCF